jgi:hypothetical protein
VKSVSLDYSRPNFFPADATNTEHTEFGLFVQAAGVIHGKGRVFLFTDSTVWSNFYMFIPGKPELLLGAMEWLNRSNSELKIVRGSTLLLGFVGLAVAAGLAGKARSLSLVPGVLSTGFITIPVVVLALEFLNHHFYGVPLENKEIVRVNFENEHSDVDFPLYHITQNPNRSYHTFFVWTQRIGAVPQLFNSVEEAICRGKVLVLLNPGKFFDELEVASLRGYIEQGGSLFLIHDPNRQPKSVVDSLLAALRVSLRIINGSPGPISMMREKRDTLVAKSTSSGIVEGGNPILFVRNRIADESELRNRMPIGRSHQHVETEQEQMQAVGPGAGIRSNMASQEMGGGVRKPPQATIRRDAKVVDTVSLRPVMATEKIGHGMIVVMASSALFTDREMGYTTMQPDQVQRKICELEYWILEQVLNLKTDH